MSERHSRCRNDGATDGLPVPTHRGAPSSVEKRLATRALLGPRFPRSPAAPFRVTAETDPTGFRFTGHTRRSFGNRPD